MAQVSPMVVDIMLEVSRDFGCINASILGVMKFRYELFVTIKIVSYWSNNSCFRLGSKNTVYYHYGMTMDKILAPPLTAHECNFYVYLQILLGIVASATGAAAAVAYIGLKGNTHVGWGKVCNMYGKFCRYLGASIGVSLFATVMLLLLVLLSVYSLSKKIPK